ncbi:MAG: alpha/beta hydrolase domain-containing protein [Gammaproteobacteria bacterium]|nr:alpha/beta hydrolase domain-containing protein [Gammaproteobacteria bacterium]
MPKSAIQIVSSVAAAALLLAASQASAQFGPGGPRGQFGGGTPVEPKAVSLPDSWHAVDGPGPIFNSAPSHLPGFTPDDFDYETNEYFVSGTADGRPYTTRLVIRLPADRSRYSGLVLAESMHSSGAAHAFEYTSLYTMDAGHAAVEILTTSPQQFEDFNAARYSVLDVSNGQANDILAQIGALVKSADGPMAGLEIRKMVLGGTSMSAGTLINYLAAHREYRTPDMQHIYDGYLPTSTGSDIPRIDVPVVHIPTMHEVQSNVTRRNDGDEPGDQYRLYEFSGIGHVDSRDNVRLLPNPCVYPLSTYPTQHYFAVGLHHLFRWVDEGILPPRADRIWIDRNIDNDGTQMVLDEHGNPVGGVRNPYVDVPVAKYIAINVAADPLPSEVSEYVEVNGPAGASIMCRLSAYQLDFSDEELRELYGSPRAYRRAFEQSVDALEAAGWSLPVYRDIMLDDAAAIDF